MTEMLKLETNKHGSTTFFVWKAKLMVRGEYIRESSYYTTKEAALESGVFWFEGYLADETTDHDTWCTMRGKVNIGDEEVDGETATIFINRDLVFVK